jgi:Transmembrane amino acid transporter protein
LCGCSGYVAFGDETTGNVLNNLDNSMPSMIARGLLGTTMLFVYPMESFVARHVCVVMFFAGKAAHEGDDTSVLNRRDRRIALTIVLYLSAVIPASIFSNLGTVLASTGAVGGSCLAYIGPGAIYLGIHGGRFLELSRNFFGRPVPLAVNVEVGDGEEVAPLYVKKPTSDATAASTEYPHDEEEEDSKLVQFMKTILWYVWLMPIWCWIASVGKSYLTGHVYELAMKSPHPIRIGNVRFASTKVRGGKTHVIMLQQNRSSNDLEGGQKKLKYQTLHPSQEFPTDTMLIRADSLPDGYEKTAEGRIVALPPTPSLSQFVPPLKPLQDKNTTSNSNSNSNSTGALTGDYGSINKNIGANLLAKRQEEEAALALEDDPQQDPPGVIDFVIAIIFISFGVVAMVAGIGSIYAAKKS